VRPRNRTLWALAAILIAAGVIGCTLVYRSQDVDLSQDRAIVGTNRVIDVHLAPR
jgi:hypothetical protein